MADTGPRGLDAASEAAALALLPQLDLGGTADNQSSSGAGGSGAGAAGVRKQHRTGVQCSARAVSPSGAAIDFEQLDACMQSVSHSAVMSTFQSFEGNGDWQRLQQLLGFFVRHQPGRTPAGPDVLPSGELALLAVSTAPIVKMEAQAGSKRKTARAYSSRKKCAADVKIEPEGDGMGDGVAVRKQVTVVAHGDDHGDDHGAVREQTMN